MTLVLFQVMIYDPQSTQKQVNNTNVWFNSKVCKRCEDSRTPKKHLFVEQVAGDKRILTNTTVPGHMVKSIGFCVTKK